MTLPPDLPVVDHHCHLSPTGEGVEAARRFARAGGTHLFLTTQQFGPATPRSVEAYQTQFETTEALAHQIQKEVGIVVYAVVAPYPVDVVPLSDEFGVPAAIDLQKKALDLAGRWVKEQRAVALGEVGRPHFSTAPELRGAADEIFLHALEVARDVGCPAVVHSEDLDAEGFRELAKFAETVAFPANRLVKHYARRVMSASETAGVIPSYLARRDIVAEALTQPGPWFLETDFLDDPRRPGAVLDLATVPRRAAQLAEKAPEMIDRLRIPFVESVSKVYGLTPITAPGRKA